MADTAVPANIKVETEGDVQVLYCTIASVADTNTTDFSKWSKRILHVSGVPSTTAAIGATVSAGVVTWKVSTGTPNLLVRLAFN